MVSAAGSWSTNIPGWKTILLPNAQSIDPSQAWMGFACFPSPIAAMPGESHGSSILWNTRLARIGSSGTNGSGKSFLCRQSIAPDQLPIMTASQGLRTIVMAMIAPTLRDSVNTRMRANAGAFNYGHARPEL